MNIWFLLYKGLGLEQLEVVSFACFVGNEMNWFIVCARKELMVKICYPI